MIEIREMTLDDLEQVMVIERANFSVPWTETGFFTYLIRSDALFLVAEEKEEILGYCGVILIPDEGEITNVAVKKERQGNGIGGMLVKALVEQAGERGAVKLFLEVRKSNLAAQKVYEKYGFVKTGERKRYYEQPVEDAVLMARGQ